ncbi:MAG TPA: hypothetical protein VJI46_04180 [Candidatus Nanoarchaeia archaeon]|nr:hypothetical protein [Candidatus Nanoarchaeia archaeon]
MCWVYVKRFVFYGGIAAIIAAPIAYKYGYNNGKLDCTVAQFNESKLEKVADNQFGVTNPDDNRRYTIDFHNKTIIPNQKKLEDIFRKQEVK